MAPRKIGDNLVVGARVGMAIGKKASKKAKKDSLLDKILWSPEMRRSFRAIQKEGSLNEGSYRRAK